MKRPISRLLAASSLLLLATAFLCAESRPRYGGTLRVQLKEAVTGVDLVESIATGAPRAELLSPLLLESLTEVDDSGTAKPALAAAWRSDAQKRVWYFTLRRNVQFHDGSPLTPAAAAGALKSVEPGWKIHASAGEVVIEADAATPALPEILALRRYAITRRTDAGALTGTGPFQIREWQPGRRILLTANEDHWRGRPYLDQVEILMGNSLREQLLDHRLDRDDVVEIGLEMIKPLTAAGQRVRVSSPADLMALIFLKALPQKADSTGAYTARPPSPTDDARLREAIALSVDRAAIANVLLQKQAAAAGGALPDWLTGYGFLFAAKPDAAKAHAIKTEIGPVPTIGLAYDSSDPAAKAIAERVAVHARETGITMQVFGEKNATVAKLASSRSAGMMVARLTLESANPSAGLRNMFGQLSTVDFALPSGATPEDIYAAETKTLEGFRIVPIAHVPNAHWVHPRVRNWTQSATGIWKLDRVWLEQAVQETERP